MAHATFAASSVEPPLHAVTHDPHAARFAKTVRHLEKGKLLPLGTLPADWATAMATRN